MKLNFNSIKHVARVVSKWAVKNAPQLMTVGGVFLMATATGQAIAVTPQAKEEVTKLDNDPELTHKEYVKKKIGVIVKNYWPTVLMTGVGGALIFGGQHISLGRLATATGLLAAKNDELIKLKDKIIEHDGEKTLEKYTTEIAQDEVKEADKKHPIGDLSTVYNTGHGNTLFFDAVGKRFFLCSHEYIRQEVTRRNEILATNMQRGKEAVFSLNEFYNMLDLPPLDGEDEDQRFIGPNIGKDIGWRNRLIRLKFICGKLDNDQPYTIMGFEEGGEPFWDHDISDDYGADYTDDSTDLPWR